MKKLILLIAIAFFAITVFAQPLKKGNLVGVHVVTVELKPGVTMEQFKDYYINKYLPQMNKLDPNWQVFIAEGIRGEHANQLGMIHCKELTFPSNQENFFILEKIIFPVSDSSVDAIFIPKNLIMLIKKKPLEKPNITVVEFKKNVEVQK